MDQNKQPEQTPAPVPVDPQVAPVEGQKVQYVITQNSLNGLSGWLLFFMIFFALIGIGGVSMFFDGLAAGVNTSDDLVKVIFGPLLSASFLASLILIALRKKIAIPVTYAAYAVFAVYTIALTLISQDSTETAGVKVGSILTGIIIYGLLALYFKQSRRVKETLIK